MRLSEGSILLNFVKAFADAGVFGVVNVDVGARSWVGRLSRFETIALVTGSKGHNHSFLLEESGSDVFLLFGLLVHAWSGVLIESGLSVRRI
mgnify:FL=1